MRAGKQGEKKEKDITMKKGKTVKTETGENKDSFMNAEMKNKRKVL
jgi:hypothetical protein